MRSPLEESVLSAIRPVPEEKEHIARVAATIIKTAAGKGGAEPMIVGSVARGTFIHGDRDLDIFLLFDPSLSREELEEEGLRLARSIADALSEGYFEKCAEHPYINAIIEGLDVDLVPCFRVDSASASRSSVDRTPFHTRYIEGRISPLIDDVLLLKQLGGTSCEWKYIANGATQESLFYIKVDFSDGSVSMWEAARKSELSNEPADIVVNNIDGLGDESYTWSSKSTGQYIVYDRKGEKTMIMRYNAQDILYMANESGIIDMADRIFNRF